MRESSKGLFSARLRSPDPGSGCVEGTLRITRAAFGQTMRRRKKLTLVDKANVLPSMASFRQVFVGLAAEFPQVETECLYVDAAALLLVQRPERFDVIVTENMFGDILSDRAAGLLGGMGMAPSADIGQRHAVFQPAHGSAWDTAGQGIAYPVAAILSAAVMLDWLEEHESADKIRQTVHAALRQQAVFVPLTRAVSAAPQT
ncbi:MAG: isocitrate/isopropylmalate family dehydrogenase [Bryobacteraceae bacterium]